MDQPTPTGGAGFGAVPGPSGGAAAPPLTAPPVTTPGAGGTGGAPVVTPPVTQPGGAAGSTAEPPDNGAMPEECHGFDFTNLIYSPGGDVLPNKCEPFDPTTNNPYAVRCIDAWPWYETKFPGDEYCILPPAPDKGVQYGVHPQGQQWFAQVSTGDMSGYENLGTEWTMEPGEEEQANYTTLMDHESFNYYRNYSRMRGGSHHMIVTAEAASAGTDTWAPGGPDFLGTSLPGAQRPDENTPKTLEKPAEDAGLYGPLQGPAGILFNMHHFNATDGQTLKEAWSNLWYETDAKIEIRPIFGLNFAQATGLAVAPETITDLHYSWNISTPMRMVMAFGHRHAWTTNFSVWVDKPDGGQDILYQSFDWFDEPTYRYDSIQQNPIPSREKLIDGGTSGVRMLAAGEKLHFNCHIEYTAARAAAENTPVTPAENGTLRFANEAFTAEMCILFGSTTNGSLLSPAADSSPLPDFAK